MQKSLALILLLIHLGTNTELIQVFKLPRLISHYFQHHRLNPSLCFSDFLSMHYGGDDGTKADDETDRKLPFHNPGHPYLSGVYFPLIQNDFDLKPPEKIAIRHINFIQQIKTSGYISPLLRPPLFS